ncbi:MAG: hypothetical protein STSR0004_13890 [Peptococcaceae bacterium]
MPIKKQYLVSFLIIFALIGLLFPLSLFAEETQGTPDSKTLLISKPVLVKETPVKILTGWRNIKLLSDLTVSVEGPAKATAGKSVDLKVIVKNNGPGEAPGTAEVEPHWAYMVDLVLSSDYSIPVKWAVQPVYQGKTKDDFVEDMLILGGRISNTKSIPSGGQVIYTLPAYIPKKTSPGVYYLGAVADPGNNVKETNENNNIYRHKIEILPPEPPVVKPPAGINSWIMPYGIGGTPLNQIKPGGLVDYTDWISGEKMNNAPFGGRLGFRHLSSNNIPTQEIKYYRWLYKHESDPAWHEFTETVGVHYVKPGVTPTFPVYILGPKVIKGMNLYEFKPYKPPGVGTYWPTTDFGDIYSGFLNSEGLPDGKYKIKLEILDKNGVLIMPNTLYKFVVPNWIAADGTIHTRLAFPAEIMAGGFVFTVHIDNRSCSANIDAPAIDTGNIADECGFLRYDPASTAPVQLAFQAKQPANFAKFTFNIWRGADFVGIASTGGEVAALSAGNYTGNGTGNFKGNFERGKLLGPTCQEGAFSANLYVLAKATTGWGHRINKLDAWDVRAFALAPK